MTWVCLTNDAGIVVLDELLQVLIGLQQDRVWTRLLPHKVVDPIYTHTHTHTLAPPTHTRLNTPAC